MSTQLNVLGSVGVQISYTGVRNLEDTKTIEKLQNQLKEIDERIETWRSICQKENIDIFPEVQALSECKSNPSAISTDYKIYLLQLVEAEERICQTIVQKVKCNLKREPTRQALETTRGRLEELTVKTIPWFSFAKTQGINIQDEFEILRAAYRSSFEQLGEDTLNKDNVKEVVQRRLYSLRLDCSIRVIHKIFRNTILKEAENEQSFDWLNDRRVEIIEGVARDAMKSLPIAGSLEEIQKRSVYVLKCFRDNLELIRKDLPEYEKVADREWLLREVQKKGIGLARYASDRGNVFLMGEILKTLRLVCAFFATPLSTEDIRERANGAFKLYAERLALSSNLMPCGFHKGLEGTRKWDDGAL